MQVQETVQKKEERLYRPFEQIMRSICSSGAIRGSLDIISGTISRARIDAKNHECPLTDDQREQILKKAKEAEDELVKYLRELCNKPAKKMN